MTTHPASCRCGQLTATYTGDPVRVSVWEERQHEWVEIAGDVEHQE